MVSTTSLRGDLEVKASELWNSEFDEDKAIATAAREAMNKVVKTLLPVIKYVDVPIKGELRGVVVATDDASGFKLILARDGSWVRGMADEKFVSDQAAWEHFPIALIFEGLQLAFTEATEKKKLHLGAVEARQNLLESIGRVIHGEEQQSA